MSGNVIHCLAPVAAAASLVTSLVQPFIDSCHTRSHKDGWRGRFVCVLSFGNHSIRGIVAGGLLAINEGLDPIVSLVDRLVAGIVSALLFGIFGAVVEMRPRLRKFTQFTFDATGLAMMIWKTYEAGKILHTVRNNAVEVACDASSLVFIFCVCMRSLSQFRKSLKPVMHTTTYGKIAKDDSNSSWVGKLLECCFPCCCSTPENDDVRGMRLWSGTKAPGDARPNKNVNDDEGGDDDFYEGL